MTDRWRSEDARRARTRQRKRTEPHYFILMGPVEGKCALCGLPFEDPVHIRPRPDA